MADRLNLTDLEAHARAETSARVAGDLSAAATSAFHRRYVPPLAVVTLPSRWSILVADDFEIDQDGELELSLEASLEVLGGAGAAVSVVEAWPVGSIFLSAVSTNPNTLLGYGTWGAIAAGRVLVGLDAGDANFDTVKKTGGAKTVAATGSNAAEAAHTHSVTSNVAVSDHTTSLDNHNPGTTSKVLAAPKTHGVTNNAVTSAAGSSHNHAFTGSASSVVQPYFVCYIWERTA